jgi:hypothetical protein
MTWALLKGRPAPLPSRTENENCASEPSNYLICAVRWNDLDFSAEPGRPDFQASGSGCTLHPVSHNFFRMQTCYLT